MHIVVVVSVVMVSGAVALFIVGGVSIGVVLIKGGLLVLVRSLERFWAILTWVSKIEAQDAGVSAFGILYGTNSTLYVYSAVYLYIVCWVLVLSLGLSAP